MKRNFCILACFLILAVLISPVVAQEPRNENVQSIVEKLRRHPDAYPYNSIPPIPMPKDTATSVCQSLLFLAKGETDIQLRCGIGQYVGMIEIVNRCHPHPRYRTRSDFFELRDELIAELEKSHGGESTIVDRIFVLFHPNDLKPVSQRIRDFIHKNPQSITQSLMVLYANLPDNSEKEELIFVKTILMQYTPVRNDNLFHQALAARFGDKTSEQQLIDLVSNLWEGKQDRGRITDVLKNLLLCAGTENVMRYVASGLQSNRQVQLPGDVSISEISVCENVLQEKYRDDPTFPQSKEYSYTDQELLELKKWCEKTFWNKVSKTNSLADSHFIHEIVRISGGIKKQNRE